MRPLVRRKLIFMVGVVLALAVAAYVGRDKGSPFARTDAVQIASQPHPPV